MSYIRCVNNVNFLKINYFLTASHCTRLSCFCFFISDQHKLSIVCIFGQQNKLGKKNANVKYQDHETCNRVELRIDKIDRSLMRDLRQDGGKSVSYNCCHLSQVCPGKLAYIQTLLLEDRKRRAEHPPATILSLHTMHV